ncbi:MAG: hypothetical protein K2I72_02635, partial [Bacilli bacterium]|nr:hypothetical protein [Bacilli bacterium]
YMPINNQEKSEMGKRSLNKKIFLGIILLIVILLTVGIFLLIKNSKKEPIKEPLEQEEEKKTSLESITDYYMLISSLNITGLPNDYFGYFFQKDSYVRLDVDNHIKIYMAIRKIMNENIEKYKDATKTITIDQKSVEQAVEELFGENTKLSHESLTGNSCSYSAFQYDKDKKSYVQKPGECAEDQTMSILMEQVDTKSTDQSKEFTIVMAFVDFTYHTESNKSVFEYYKDINKQVPIGTSEQYDLEAFRTLANTYKFTFIKKGENFVFDKVEKIS